MSEREQLYRFINEVSFATFDCRLYLDTHPCDEDALAYYEKYNQLRECAVEEYNKKYGPITCNCNEGCTWNWIESPWPWKGDC